MGRGGLKVQVHGGKKNGSLFSGANCGAESHRHTSRDRQTAARARQLVLASRRLQITHALAYFENTHLNVAPPGSHVKDCDSCFNLSRWMMIIININISDCVSVPPTCVVCAQSLCDLKRLKTN